MVEYLESSYQDIKTLRMGAAALLKQGLYEEAEGALELTACNLVARRLEDSIVNSILGHCSSAAEFEQQLGQLLNTENGVLDLMKKDHFRQDSPSAFQARNWWGDSINLENLRKVLAPMVMERLTEARNESEDLYSALKPDL